VYKYKLCLTKAYISTSFGYHSLVLAVITL